MNAPPDRAGRGVAFLCSHNGSNLAALLRQVADGTLDADIRIVISNNSGARALAVGREAGLAAHHVSGRTTADPDAAICNLLASAGVGLVCLSGYMKRIGPRVLERYRGHIVNVHPSLLPAYGGAGMYGDAVFEAVLAAGETETGATLHVVDGDYDTGPVLARRKVAVAAGDTVATLRPRVQAAEQALYAGLLANWQRRGTVEIA